jgi:phospholipid N-methyltransferase
MPTVEWLKKEFYYGYDSGDVLSLIPNFRRFQEEKKIGGSYRKLFYQAVIPYMNPDSMVLELGPGRGSWSKAILKYLSSGKLQTVDFQDVSQWLKPEKYQGKLICHQVTDNSLSCIADNSIDFFWSFGVLCHNNVERIEEILKNALSKMKVGGFAVHEYADWKKLDNYGWERGKIPVSFQKLPDNEIWWPRNDRETMCQIATKSGWKVVNPDLGLVKRDSIIVLQKA